MITDTHAHLTYKGLREDVPAALARAARVGVTRVITVATDLADSRAAVKTAHAHDNVWATVGVHPHDAETLDDAAMEELLALAKDPRVVGWGETGLDYFRNYCPHEVQRRAFRRQAEAARGLGLPLVIHDREAHREVLEVLREQTAKGLRGVVHCFSGDVAFAREVLDTGFYLSIPGTVTYPKNTMLQEVVRAMPLERCMVETDAPFLSPQPVRSKKNEPAFVRHTVEMIAELKGLSVADVARITSRAAYELFGVGEAEASRIAYPIRDGLYLNVTERCTNRCAFCAKNRSSVVKGHDLALASEPTVAELLAAVEENGGVGAWSEIVFCGFGEPLLRLDTVVETARRLRERGARRIRVNTDGLGALVHGVDVVGRLEGVVDAVSVSMNAPDEATYGRLCRPTLSGSFAAVKDFIREAAARLPEVTATVVAVDGLDIARSRELAVSLGARFRSRPYNEVG